MIEPAVIQAAGAASGAIAALVGGDSLTTAAEVWWIALRWLTVYAAIAIFISSTEDAFIDLYFWLSTLQAKLIALVVRPASTEALYAKPQKRIAIIVPAWNEADVIADMLRANLARIDYDAFDIFVGVYQNDPATREAVDAVCETDPRVMRATVRSDGPSSKADALNWLIHAVLSHERTTGTPYEVIVMQDAEDVIHPAALRVFNWHCERGDMIQLPVLSMPRPSRALVAAHYMDEFAEWHTKDLVTRSRLSGIVPSAGVATGFTRRAVQTLLSEGDGQVFNTNSLTEDYDVGQRLRQHGLHGRFVRQYVRPLREDGRRGQRDLVATREFFPSTLKASVVQKARWTLGISILGWRDLGWFGSFADRYFLYRDRKTLWTAPTGMLAYAIIVQFSIYEGVKLIAPEADVLPALIEESSWVWALILMNFWFLLNRVFHRVLCTLYVHGIGAALLAPLRLPVANYIAFLAVIRALRLYIVHRFTGKALTWDKTTHSYPSDTEINALFDGAPRFSLKPAPPLAPLPLDATRLDVARLEPARAAQVDPDDLSLARAFALEPSALARARSALAGQDGSERYARLRSAANRQGGAPVIDLDILCAHLEAPDQHPRSS